MESLARKRQNDRGRPGGSGVLGARSRAGGHVRVLGLIIIAVTIVGTLGYVAFEGWSIDDGLYMTVITMTTVGYKEVRDLDATGRLWTMLLAIAGVAIIFGSIGIVAESILTEAASGRRERRRMTDAVGPRAGISSCAATGASGRRSRVS